MESLVYNYKDYNYLSYNTNYKFITNTFNLHFLFDPYVSEHLGNVSIEALQSFIANLELIEEGKSLVKVTDFLKS